MMHVNLSVEKGTTVSQKDLKAFAPKTVKVKCGYSSYVGHFGFIAQGPAKDLRQFLRDYIPFGASFLERGPIKNWHTV
jgi:hypothetical protein